MIIRSSPSRYKTDAGRGAFDGEARREGQVPSVETVITTAEVISADLIYYDDPKEDCKTLRPFGTMVKRDRVMRLDGKVAKIAASWFSHDLAEGTLLMEEDTGPGGSFARFAELGHKIVRLTEDVTVAEADASAEALGLEKGSCIFKIVRSAFDDRDQLIEVTSETFSPHTYQLQFDVQLEDVCVLTPGQVQQIAREIKREIRDLYHSLADEPGDLLRLPGKGICRPCGRMAYHLRGLRRLRACVPGAGSADPG